MRRLLVLTLPLLLTAACDSEEDGRNAEILALDGNPAAGEMVFANNTCSTDACHGSDGNSGTGTAPALNTVVSGLSDDQIINAVLDGDGAMPPQDLEDQEMADVLAWLRTEF